MKIGVAGPISLPLLKALFPNASTFPRTMTFPLVSLIAENLYKRKHEIVIFALSPDVTTTQVLSGKRIQAYLCPQRRARWQMLDFFRGERRALCDAMQRSNCDVIHAFWTYEFAAAAIASGIPHVITAQDIPRIVLRFAQHPYWLVKPLLGWPVLRQAKCVTTVSPYAADSLNRSFRPNKDISVIANGINAPIFAMHARRLNRRPSEKIVFASILNEWAGRKNGEQLLTAFGKVRTKLGSRAELWMFGTNHGADEPAHKWASARSLDAGVRFLGAIPYHDVLAALADDVDILVHPSLEESFGMAVAEAMAIGVPVIGGKHSGAVPWVLDYGNAGLLVDVTSTHSIAEGMLKMADNAGYRQDLAHAARQVALSRYHLDGVVDSYEALLEHAVREQAH